MSQGVANAEEFCKALRIQRPDDGYCIDCGADRPEWASVSNGVLICLQCAGQHRSLGVHVSFVRSIAMDAWKPEHLAMVKLGGNQRFKQMLQETGTHGLPKIAKYSTPAAEAYRAVLKEAATGGIPAVCPSPPLAASPPAPAKAPTAEVLTASNGGAPATAAVPKVAKIDIWSDELWE
mmetsp:Transcript_33027/g.60556  ORF Transcript_33027/g.60556 Transcript_33027/m.60556 type:complete len:178 (+) Transcript_33027:73-606(+)